MKLKLRFLLGGSIIFILGLALGAVRGYGTNFEALMGIGVALLVLGLFWKDKPSVKTGDQPGTP
jgi:hypothetical protein